MRIRTYLRTESFLLFGGSFCGHCNAIAQRYSLFTFSVRLSISSILSFVTRKYHLKVLELLHLLQRIAAYLQRALAWVFGKMP